MVNTVNVALMRSGERSLLAACTVKVKTITPLKKVFEAAEVRTLDSHYNHLA